MARFLRSILGWVFVRYKHGYTLFGSVLTAVNTAGIFTLVLQQYFDIPPYVFMPLIVVCGAVAFVGFGFVVYDKLNFQTTIVEKEGRLHEYWNTRLNPITQKKILLDIKMYKAIIKKDLDGLAEVEKVIEKGLL